MDRNGLFFAEMNKKAHISQKMEELNIKYIAYLCGNDYKICIL